MAGSNNFLQWNPSQTNQENDAAYLADAQRVGGAPSGNVFPSLTGNKLFYQLSTFVAAFAQMMATKGFNMQDGNLSTLASALAAVLTTADLQGNIQNVSWAPTVNLDCSKYNGFQIALNGNVILNPSGMVPGQKLAFIFTQDATGGRTVTFPFNWSGTWQPDPSPFIQSIVLVEIDVTGTEFVVCSPVLSNNGMVNTPLNMVGTPAAAKFLTRTPGDSTTFAANTAFVTAALAAAIGGLGISISGQSVSLLGLVIKWGETISFDTGPTNVTFPGPAGAFPHACFQVLMTDSYDDGNVTTRIWEVASISAAGFQCRNNGTGSGKWIAVGW